MLGAQMLRATNLLIPVIWSKEKTMEPTEHFEHDPDDPIPREDGYWYFMNRWAENVLRWFRLFY